MTRQHQFLKSSLERGTERVNVDVFSPFSVFNKQYISLYWGGGFTQDGFAVVFALLDCSHLLSGVFNSIHLACYQLTVRQYCEEVLLKYNCWCEILQTLN